MMTLTEKLTQGFIGLMYSRKGALCLIILLLTASLLLIAGFCSHWNSSILVAAFGCFGVIGSVVSAIFCNGNVQETIAAANNANAITLANNSTTAATATAAASVAAAAATVAAASGSPDAGGSQVTTSPMGNGPPPPSNQ
jgi:hypothetical protein